MTPCLDRAGYKALFGGNHPSFVPRPPDFIRRILHAMSHVLRLEGGETGDRDHR